MPITGPTCNIIFYTPTFQGVLNAYATSLWCLVLCIHFQYLTNMEIQLPLTSLVHYLSTMVITWSLPAMTACMLISVSSFIRLQLLPRSLPLFSLPTGIVKMGCQQKSFQTMISFSFLSSGMCSINVSNRCQAWDVDCVPHPNGQCQWVHQQDSHSTSLPLYWPSLKRMVFCPWTLPIAWQDSCPSDFTWAAFLIFYHPLLHERPPTWASWHSCTSVRFATVLWDAHDNLLAATSAKQHFSHTFWQNVCIPHNHIKSCAH